MFDKMLLSGKNIFLNMSYLSCGFSFPISSTIAIFSFSVAWSDWMADDIASIDTVVPIILGFFATNRARAVPIPIATGIIRPA